jgi:hypothetical protein
LVVEAGVTSPNSVHGQVLTGTFTVTEAGEPRFALSSAARLRTVVCPGSDGVQL